MLWSLRYNFELQNVFIGAVFGNTDKIPLDFSYARAGRSPQCFQKPRLGRHFVIHRYKYGNVS